MTMKRPLTHIAWVFAIGAGVAVVSISLRAADEDDEAPAPQPMRTMVVDGMPGVRLNEAEQKHAGIELRVLPTVTHVPRRQGYAAVLDIVPLLDAAQHLSDAQAQLQSANATLTQSQAEYTRAHDLHDAGQNISDRELQSEEAAWHRAQAAAGSARRSLAAERAALNAMWGPVMAEWVEKQSQAFAALARGEDRLIRINLSGAMFATAPGEARVQAPDGTWVDAMLISEAARADPVFQQIAYLFRAPAAHGLLPGLNLRAEVKASEAGVKQTGVIVPASAVVWWQGRSWAYVQEKPGTFVRRRIAIDEPEEQGGYFVTGLPGSAAVVVAGAEAILSEETRPAVAPEQD